MFDKEQLKSIKAKKEEWDCGPVEKVCAKFPERRPVFTTISGEEVDRLYTPADVADFDYENKLGFPGEYPFTRGVQPTMYRGRLWTMRQYAGFGTARETNARYRYLLKQGQTGLSVAFDLPTQSGYDSDHPLSMGEVGKVGVAIDSIDDMQVLFDQIPLDKVTTSMTINAPATVLLAMYLALAEAQDVPYDKVGGTVQNDILKEIICRGQYIYPPLPSMRLTRAGARRGRRRATGSHSLCVRRPAPAQRLDLPRVGRQGHSDAVQRVLRPRALESPRLLGLAARPTVAASSPRHPPIQPEPPIPPSRQDHN